MMFFTADTHLGHANIIKYCNRPFCDVKEMDEALIENWNSVVGADDTVIHCGDFCWTGNMTKVTEFRYRLNGHISLLPGNHDSKSALKSFDARGELLPPIHNVKVDGRRITCCHYPMCSWDRSHFGTWHVFGHHHGTYAPQGMLVMDVGVDANGYTPVSIEQVEAHMETIAGDNPNWTSKLPGAPREWDVNPLTLGLSYEELEERADAAAG